MLILFICHLVGALLSIPLIRALKSRGFYLLSLFPLSGMLWSLSALGATHSSTVHWVESLGLDIALRHDSLSAIMSLSIFTISTLVMLYCVHYFDDNEPRLHLFAAQMLAFTGVMFGLVIADNMLLLYILWELTSVLSFLLVGHYAERATSRQEATKALLVTVLGGLAMLVGIIILGETTGSYLISDLVTRFPAGEFLSTTSHSGHHSSQQVIDVAVALILVGALSKSAIAPFHFWLPGAMAAPTPVSAFLHSAAMVKAGIYLIARLSPVLSIAGTWQLPLISLGLLTMLLGGWRALFQRDLKLILAYGTISQLGFIMTLIAVGSRNTMLAGLTALLAHALFKACLFMVVGIVEHRTKTRDVLQLSFVARRFPGVAAIATVAAASMAGLPPMLGFISKEAAFATVLADARVHGMPSKIVAFLLVVGSILTFAYSARFLKAGFFSDSQATASTPSRSLDVEYRFAAVIPAGLLAAAGLFAGVNAHQVEKLLAPFANTIPWTDTVAIRLLPWQHTQPVMDTYHLGLWHGIDLPLVMTLTVYSCGFGLFLLADILYPWVGHAKSLGDAQWVYRSILAGADRISLKITAFLQRGSLPLTLATILVTFVVFPLSSVLSYPRPGMKMELTFTLGALLLLLPIGAAAISAIIIRNRLAAVLLVGAIGYGMAVIFALYGAPDLALAQGVVETFVLVMFVLVLRALPADIPESNAFMRSKSFLAVSVGLLTIVAGAYALNARTHPAVADAFPTLAYDRGHGANAVNVTLVDIRAWDTLGEITVLVVAATGVASLLFRTRRWVPALPSQPVARRTPNLVRSARASARIPVRLLTTYQGNLPKLTGSTVILDHTMRVLFPIIMMVSVYLFFAGHNRPGGGFSGGLVAGIALCLVYLTAGSQALQATVRLDAGWLLGGGLALMCGTALAPLLWGYPVLSSHLWELDLGLFGSTKLVTALFFDAGVYAIVVGLVLDVLSSLGTRIDTDLERSAARER